MVGVIDAVVVGGGSGDDGEVEGLWGAGERGRSEGGWGQLSWYIVTYISVYNNNR